MPLLGRHKSSNSSSPSGQASSQGVNLASSSSSTSSSSSLPSSSGGGINQNTGTGSLSHTRQVCDSPLFGVRKQISFSGQEDNLMKTGGASSNITTTTTSNQQSINTNSLSSSSSNNQTYHSQHSQLNSIPQQITSQQIHYAFSIMDTNQDGMIDLRDLSQMLANLGVPIDEAILSHIMSSVSKRGDHRISEAEFLDWISKFIQVSDHGGINVDHQLKQQHQLHEPTLSRNSNRLLNKRNASSTSRAPMSRSSTTGFSSQLVAQPVAQLAEVARSRRGSGSGLALMRSLSSSAANTAASTVTNSPPLTATSISAAGSAPSIGSLSSSRLAAATTTTTTNSSSQQDLDAIHDLKAAFCVFDLDADGYITIDEVQAGLKLLGESWSPNELKQLLSKCSASSSSPSSSSSPTSSKSQDLNKLSKRQQEQQLLKQRISIDDFVRLLL